jgi:A/G-specific adenine glycosylase
VCQRSGRERRESGAERLALPDPYHVLVSEFMLQQTQVATVIPYFLRFIARFPAIADLARAPEQEVLRMWQGLGYYSRARNLRRCAQQVANEFGGRLPAEVQVLRTLPGIGRYTAGAISSIAFERRAPIVDGNVSRVLCRLDRVETDPRTVGTIGRLWTRAGELVPNERVGDFNSALMELGAVVCVPRNPQCLLCPVREHCQALAAGVQDQIPRPRKSRPAPVLKRRTFCIRRGDTWLIEQRPARGRWAGMWQFVTVEGAAQSRGAREPSACDALPISVTRLARLGSVSHGLTHRRYEFEVYRCDAAAARNRPVASPHDQPRRWVTLDELSRYPLPRPHVRIAEMLRPGGADARAGRVRPQ